MLPASSPSEWRRRQWYVLGSQWQHDVIWCSLQLISLPLIQFAENGVFYHQLQVSVSSADTVLGQWLMEGHGCLIHSAVILFLAAKIAAVSEVWKVHCRASGTSCSWLNTLVRLWCGISHMTFGSSMWVCMHRNRWRMVCLPLVFIRFLSHDLT